MQHSYFSIIILFYHIFQSLTLRIEMMNPITEGVPQAIFIYGTYSEDETNSGVTKRLSIIAAVGFRLKMVVANNLSFGENQF